MKRIKSSAIAFIIGVTLAPASVFAINTALDGATDGSSLQPFPFWSDAEILGSYFTASSTATNTLATLESDNVDISTSLRLFGTLFTDLASFLFETELDTEAELEAQLTDVSDVYTNNDGTLDEDDLSDDDLDALQNVASLTESNGDILYYNSGAWQVLSVGSNGQVLKLSSGLPSWGTDLTGGGSGGSISTSSVPTVNDLAYWTSESTLASIATSSLRFTESQITDLDHFTGADITGSETAFDGWDKDASNDYTSTDFDTDFSGKTTTDLSEGTNLYYTEARVVAELLDGNNAVFGTATSTNFVVTTALNLFGTALTSFADLWSALESSANTWFGTKDTDDLTEGSTNLYNQTHTGDVTGSTALTIANGAVDPAMLSDSDFGDWSCTSGVCSLDASTVSDNEIDYTTVTLNDLTFDVGSVSKTEYGYLNGVTSAIQTQLDTKFDSLGDFTGTLTDTRYCTYDSAGGEIDCDSVPAGGGSTISTSTTLADTQIIYATGVDSIGSTANFTFDSASSIFTIASSSSSGKLTIEGDDILSSVSGTLTLGNVDAIDATTESTIESAIDTLSNLTSIGTITTGVWSATDIAVVAGGTGASTESGARTNLGLAIGSDVQAFDAVLDDLSALSVVADNEFIVGTGAGTYAHESGATVRTSLGLGSLATLSTINNSNWSGTDLSVANGGTGASTLTDGGVLLGSGTGAITPMGVLADGAIIVGDGTTDPVAESGATARTSLGVAIGSDVQAYDADLTTYAGITPSANVQSLLAAADYAAFVALLESAIESAIDTLGNLIVDVLTYDAAKGTVTALGNIGATETMSFASVTAYTATLDANTTITISGTDTGQRGSISLYYDSSTQRTIAWSGIDSWIGGAPTDGPTDSNPLVVTIWDDGISVIGSWAQTE